MKLLNLSLGIAAVAAMVTTAQAQNWDFQYSYANVFAPNALNYVVQQQNIERSNEGAGGDTYWNPINAGTPAILTQEFTFSAPTTKIYLSADLETFNFGGGDYGSASLLASTDGQHWTDLADSPTPASGGGGIIYAQDLPSSLLGANQIYIQAQLNASGSDIMAQFMREYNPIPTEYTPFTLDVDVVPEPSTTLLMLVGLALVLHRGVKRYFPHLRQPPRVSK
jgi:PEP-CTERM motif